MINLFIIRCAGAALTLYMLALLLRWLGPFIDFDVEDQRYLRWIPKLTDPYLAKVKELVPALGLANLGTVVAIFAVWILRFIIIGQ